MLVECKSCGAPLDVGSGARIVKCAYCNHANRVRSMNTIAQQSPQGWQPPPTWTPPQHAQAPSQPMQYHGTKSYGTGCVVWLPILIMSLAGLLPALLATGALGRVTDAIGITGWEGEEPFRCGGNDSVTIDGVTADLGLRTAIVVSANCELTIKNSTIKAGEGVRATGNRRVVIENTRIESDDAAIWVGGNKDVEIIESTLVSTQSAVVAGGNASIRAVGGRIEAGDLAFELSANADKDVRGTTILENQGSGQRAATPTGRTDPSPAGVTETRRVDVRGSLPRELIVRVVRSKRRALRRCYEDGAKKDPGLSGELTVRFTVTGEGKVSTATVADSSLGDGAVERCMLDAIKNARFPQPQDEGITIVEYPLTFTQDG